MTDKDTPVVCDPTALVTKDIWDVVRSSKRFTDEKYIFCYFLGKNPEHRIFANRVKELTGYNIIALQHLDEFVKDDLGFADIKPFDVGPDDFISLIADAAIVLTDSFHGTMFSIYYHKDFLTFSRFNDRKRDSTNSRIDSILKILDLETRKIDSFENAHKALTSIDNWVEVDKRLDAFRAFSLSYLKNIIKEYELGKDTNRLDTVVDKERDECTGCTACVATCPMHAIDMKSDVEGFNYPSIDHEICVKCGMCLKVCPVGKAIQNEPCKAYAAKNNDVAIRTSSSSGGMFSSLANYILNKGGVVFGAGYNESFEVVHMAADNEQLLSNLRASKYVQSDLGDSFRAIENILKKNRWVLFVGTPCQVAGLKSFLKKEYDTLIVVDVLCYGVPSPMVFKSFIEFLQTKNKSKIKEFYFRDKKFGYSSPNVKAIYENGLIEEMTSDVKSFARSFFSGITTRPSCFNCAFKGMNRLADLTLGDLWIVDDISQDMDDETGTTLVFAYSDKAAKLVSDLNNVQLKEISIPLAIKKAGPMLYRSAKVNARRDAFFNDIQTLSYEECIRKYVPESLKSRLANIIKPIIKNTWLAKAVLFKNIKKLKISKESK